MSAVSATKSKRAIPAGDEYVPHSAWVADAEGTNMAECAMKTIREGEASDVVWMNQVEVLLGGLDDDLANGQMRLNAYILRILEEIK